MHEESLLGRASSTARWSWGSGRTCTRHRGTHDTPGGRGWQYRRMDPVARIIDLQSRLLLRVRLRDDGVHDRVIAAALRTGTWHRLARGVYVESPTFTRWTPDGQHLARAVAVSVNATSARPVFSHMTAAILLGLPGYGMHNERVHVTLVGSGHAHSSRDIVRHQAAIEPSEIVEIGGLLCTSLPRTLRDVARLASAEQSIVVLDAGLRRAVALAPRRDAAQAESEWQAMLGEDLAAMPGARGVDQARRRLAIADIRSESVAESLSRLQLRRLGYEVDLQVGVPSPSSSLYRVDFALLGKQTLGEVDGDAKYTDERLRGARTSEEVVLAEKRREDWIRGATGFGLVRWGFKESRSARLLGARLRAFSVPPP